jgi:hypothetical protein
MRAHKVHWSPPRYNGMVYCKAARWASPRTTADPSDVTCKACGFRLGRTNRFTPRIVAWLYSTDEED